MVQKLNTRIVTIEAVREHDVRHSKGLLASIDYFPGAKVGQKWLLTTDDAPPFIYGTIVKAELKPETS